MNEYEKEAREVAGKYGIEIRPLKKEYKNFSSLFESGIIPDDILEIC